MKRWLVYCLVGLFFGVADWYYLNALAHFSWGGLGDSILVVPIIIALNYGIWLVPVVPVTLFEARSSSRIWNAVAAGILTWSAAMIGYYSFYAVLLSLGMLPHLESLNMFGRQGPDFWKEWWIVFRRVVLNQFFEWIIVAIVGGGIVGGITHRTYRVWANRSQ